MYGLVPQAMRILSAVIISFAIAIFFSPMNLHSCKKMRGFLLSFNLSFILLASVSTILLTLFIIFSKSIEYSSTLMPKISAFLIISIMLAL